MKPNIRSAALAAFVLAASSLTPASFVQAQTANGTNSGLPGGHPHSDTSKPGNGEHGNNGGNGG